MTSAELSDKINTLIDSSSEKIRFGDIDGAIGDLKSAECLDPGNVIVLRSIASAYAKDGLFRTAIEYCEKIEKLNSGYIDIHQIKKLKAFSLAMTNNYDMAEKITREVLFSFPDDSQSLGILGFIYDKMNRRKEALDCYKKIISKDSSNATALNSIAFLMVETGSDLNAALSFAKKALEANRDNPAYLDTIGYVYLRRGETEMAKKYLKAAFEKMPENEEIKSHLNELLKL
ncbi:MAG: tetratricopeptide repeat protein [Spirochaetes bacterium]|nr:tetratricopeptide repeat protein [Spirochaetota bacterium]